jgi:tRNA threonylcarbamoyladenosine biosynthesis protein TsaB
LRSLTPSIAFASEEMATGHAECLMPMIEMVMADAGLQFAELDRIAITSGPGTFTGTRIAVAAARALSLATAASVVSISSLELMAMNPEVVASGSDSIAIATDARRGEVYFQHFDARTLKPRAAPAVLLIERAADALASGSSVIAGSGAAVVAEVARAAGCNARAILPHLVPEAIDLLFAAMTMPVVRNVSPLYLRPPDAKPPAPTPFAGNFA